MLRTISSIANAIGALNYKGTWNASTNTPTLASGIGIKGDYYQVSVAGTTAIDSISNWGIGDVISFNGTTWQRIEGGADLNGVNLSVSGTSTLSGLTASTALALDASKNAVSVANTGTGNNVLQTSPTLIGDVALSTGNVVLGTAGKGIDFSAASHAAGMTSELLNDYEEGTWTPEFISTGAVFAYAEQYGSYVKVGNLATLQMRLRASSVTGTTTNSTNITGIPFASANLNANNASAGSVGLCDVTGGLAMSIGNNTASEISLWNFGIVAQPTAASISGIYLIATISYRTA